MVAVQFERILNRIIRSLKHIIASNQDYDRNAVANIAKGCGFVIWVFNRLIDEIDDSWRNITWHVVGILNVQLKWYAITINISDFRQQRYLCFRCNSLTFGWHFVFQSDVSVIRNGRVHGSTWWKRCIVLKYKCYLYMCFFNGVYYFCMLKPWFRLSSIYPAWYIWYILYKAIIKSILFIRLITSHYWTSPCDFF